MIPIGTRVVIKMKEFTKPLRGKVVGIDATPETPHPYIVKLFRKGTARFSKLEVKKYKPTKL